MTDDQCPGGGREAGLAVHGWEGMKRKLLWPLDHDVHTGGLPANDVLVFRAFELSSALSSTLCHLTGSRAWDWEWSVLRWRHQPSDKSK